MFGKTLEDEDDRYLDIALSIIFRPVLDLQLCILRACLLLFGLHNSPKRQGSICWRPNLAITDRSDWSGPVIRVGLGFCVKNPIVTRFGRGKSSPAYKYKGCGRLRFF